MKSEQDCDLKGLNVFTLIQETQDYAGGRIKGWLFAFYYLTCGSKSASVSGNVVGEDD